MSKTVAQKLLNELLNHHKYATKLQAEVVKKTEAAQRKLAARNAGASAGSATAAAGPEYAAKPLDPKVIDNFKLNELREQDVKEIVDYLQHQRQYKQLLERYASVPEDNLERVQATARRVGLDASEL